VSNAPDTPEIADRGERRRRPGVTVTRAAILDAARDEFATHGYDRATVRGIAAVAGVDPALVLHYFGSKAGLFDEAIDFPMEPAEVLRSSAAADVEGIGATVVRSFLEGWEEGENRRRLVALLRSAMTNDAALAHVREYLGRRVFGPVTRELAVVDGDLRATLVGSQLVGLAILRYVACIEPLASASRDDLVAAVGPSVQRYITGELAVEGSGGTDPHP
jgi:AcrR family transcriptional regulator